MSIPCENCLTLAICRHRAKLAISFGDLNCNIILDYIFENATLSYNHPPPELYSILHISQSSEIRNMKFAKMTYDRGELRSTYDTTKGRYKEIEK